LFVLRPRFVSRMLARYVRRNARVAVFQIELVKRAIEHGLMAAPHGRSLPQFADWMIDRSQ
jgi:hypothetical protein